jgi:hypothetical protein
MPKKAPIDDYKAVALFWNGQEESLNTQQLQLFARIDLAGNLIAKFGRGKATVDKLLKKFSLENTPYNRKQAYRDMDMAVELFNAQSRKSKEMHKIYAIDKLERAINVLMCDLRDNVHKVGDEGSEVTFRDVDKDVKITNALARIMKEYRESTEYDKEDPDLPVFQDMGANDYILTTDPEEAGFEIVDVDEELRKKYELPKAKMDAEDVDFEEIDE